MQKALIYLNLPTESRILAINILDFIQFLTFLTVCFLYHCMSFYVLFVWTVLKINKLLNMLSR